MAVVKCCGKATLTVFPEDPGPNPSIQMDG